MKLSIASLVLFFSLALAPVAQAQSAHLDVDTQLRPIDHELASIDVESATATGFYVAGTIVLVTGGVIAGGAALLQGGTFIGGGDYHETIDAGLIIGAIGLAAVGFAIGLDVDSGSRRRAHDARLALVPSTTGAMLSVSGTF